MSEDTDLCECGNYMSCPRLCPDGAHRCTACYLVLTTPVQASTRLNLRR